MNREELIQLIIDEEDEKDEQAALERMRRFSDMSRKQKQKSTHKFGKKKLKEINRRSK